MVRGFILTFHSQNIAGNTYATNDHVALDETLVTLRRLAVPVLRLLDVVRHLRAGTLSRLPVKFACITLDDGTDFDWRDMGHPTQGWQRSMYSILRMHSRRFLGPLWLRKMHATSFVIASPVARSEIAISHTGDPGWISDGWWRQARRSGLLDIGSHGWNHVHPAVSEVRLRPELIEAFHRIDTSEDAELQMEASFRFIRDKAGGDSARLFAYPLGQVSEFIANEYLPSQRNYLGAFTTEGVPLHQGRDVWRLPRYVCGWHWKSDEELCRLLVDG